MKYTTPYNRYTGDDSLRKEAQAKADRFVQAEGQFHLGGLPTEQSHPYTVDFSSTVQTDASEGVRMLFSVDQELSSIARRTFLSAEFDSLVKAFLDVLHEGRRVCFSGCGSTGRLSIMLEEMWRAFWEDRAGVSPGAAEESTANEPNVGDALAIARAACSIMTGGDRALIASVEGFEDFETFGARQVADLDLQKDDLLVAISEGGETSSVIGTAEEALRRGCRVFFVFNNPATLLSRDIERSRRLLEKDVVALDLFSGQMALSGSTRMQATTLEMLVVGAAMEEAFVRFTAPAPKQDRLEIADRFAGLLASFQEPANRKVLGSVAEAEAAIYREGGRVTYFAERFLLDILCDTTERTPTFMLPPFRPADDSTSPVSWAYAKDPAHDSDAAWFHMLRRKPRGISWRSNDYRAMDAPFAVIENPPGLDEAEIARYRIGSEPDASRYSVDPYLFISFSVQKASAEHPAEPVDLPGYKEGHHRHLVALRAGETRANVPEHAWVLSLSMPESPVHLFEHLAVKLLFNTMSTASMGVIGRIRGNWMVQVDCTNKKLIDRGSRIIATIASIPYEQACYELYLSLLAQEEARKRGESPGTSAVVASLERLGLR